MDAIEIGQTGPAVEDVQHRLMLIGHLTEGQVTGTYDDITAQAVAAFCANVGLPASGEVNDKTWAALVDASYSLGDRTLYLRMPYFHGHDVLELQQALGALGFAVGHEDAIFGAYTEMALRKFQMNLGLPSDGIAGAYTYAALRNLHHSWVGKGAPHVPLQLGFARAADVLEANALCLFGTDGFTRSVASRMSNLALATNPASKIVSADSLSVAPDAGMLLVHVVVQGAPAEEAVPVVDCADDEGLALRLRSAITAARAAQPPRITLALPGATWEDAGADRSAQHFAITLLDALCQALAE
ncbi:MAG: peptidoglycan-binding protein [Eggerthellaceae bacterium]|nr:peptidoglycan-binding protein [Eggerthellaceae bacterium]